MKHILPVLLAALLPCYAVNAQNRDKKIYADGEIIAMMYSNEDAEKLATSLKNTDGKEIAFSSPECLSRDMNTWLFTFGTELISTERMLEAFFTSPLVRVAQFNHYGVQERLVPNDTHYPDQWAHNNHGQDQYYPNSSGDMQTQEAWDINTGNGGVTSTGDTMVVAVIDGGIKYNHEDLKYFVNYHEIPGNNIDDDGNGYKDDINGYDGVSNDMSVAVNDHGTHVAGIIGAVGNNGKGVAGVCWGVKIMPIQGIWTGHPSNSTKEAIVLRSYGYVLAMRKLYNQTNGAKGAFVVATNSSFGVDNGLPSQFPLWCAFYDSLGKAGIISATATTNGSTNVDVAGDIPTGCTSPWMIGVGRTNPDDACAGGWGPNSVDLGAPGFWIYSTSSNTPGYVRMTGTSMSTPAVAGAIALMFAEACPQMMADYKQYPDSIALLMKDYLLQSVDTVGALATKFKTKGRMNIEKALKAVQTYNCSLTDMHQHDDMGIQEVYPNPATSTLFVDFYHDQESGVTMEVYDLAGKMIPTVTTIQSKEKGAIDVNFLPAGYYFLKISEGKGRFVMKKFIKQ